MSAIYDLIEDYKENGMKDVDALDELLTDYRSNKTRGMKECLSIVKIFGDFIAESSTASLKEEDLLIKNLVDPFLIDPFFKKMENTIMHDNGHPLEESRVRKLKHAKKYREATRGVRGRAPDKSLELSLESKKKYHVFVCEVKTEGSAKDHYDLGKTGASLKDLLDYALESGAPSTYAATGLLVEGPVCRVYTLTLPVKKLYIMTEMAKFSLPTDINTLDRLGEIIDGMTLCRGLVEESIKAIRSIDPGISHQAEELDSMVESSSSPPHYSDYYK